MTSRDVPPRFPGLGGIWQTTSYLGYKLAPPLDVHPVWLLSWDHAQAFCAWLSRKDGQRYRLPTDPKGAARWGFGEDEPRSRSASPEKLSGRLPNKYPWGDFPPKTKERAGNGADESFRRQFPSSRSEDRTMRMAFPRQLR